MDPCRVCFHNSPACGPMYCCSVGLIPSCLAVTVTVLSTPAHSARQVQEPFLHCNVQRGGLATRPAPLAVTAHSSRPDTAACCGAHVAAASHMIGWDWLVEHVYVFLRSFLLLQLLACCRLFLFAVPLSKRAKRTNRVLHRARRSLRGAPLLLVFMCVVPYARAMPGLPQPVDHSGHWVSHRSC